MNRSLFITTLILITLMTLAASLPSNFYKSDSNLFIKITIGFTSLGLIALGLYFYI